METVRAILDNPEMKNWKGMPGYSEKKSERRRALIEIQIRRMFLSQGQPLPEEEALQFRIHDALFLWDEIPDSQLGAVVSEAMIESGGFIPGNGHVVKCWRSMRDEKRGARDSAEESRKYLDYLQSLPRTDPEIWSAWAKAEIKKFS